MSLELQPINRDEAFAFVKRHHRHHPAPQGWKFGVAVNDGAQVVGVLTVGRPVARGLDDGYTLEVTRCCVLEEARNACSMLYAAAWRAARALGYRRLVTYTPAGSAANVGAGTKTIAAFALVVNRQNKGELDAEHQPQQPSRGRV